MDIQHFVTPVAAFTLVTLAASTFLACGPEERSGNLPVDDDDVQLADCGEAHVDWTVGVVHCDPRAWDGYTLFSPLPSTDTYLVDIQGREVHRWDSDYHAGDSVYLLEDGNLLRAIQVENATFGDTGGSGGGVELLDWDGDVLWNYIYSTPEHHQHHDVEPLPSGNVVLVAWERKTEAEAVEAGRAPDLLPAGELWPDHLIEIDPSTDAIVWEWHLWDHLVQDFDGSQTNYGEVAEHPELVDLNRVQGNGSNAGGADWIHMNSVAYNAGLDQLVLSSHHYNEIWVLDHSTTSEEAAGHTGGRSGQGGDLLYRWGNPQSFGAGTASEAQLKRQHDAHWIADGLPGEGNILIFNNYVANGFSSVVEIVPPPVDATGLYPLESGAPYDPVEPAWVYMGETSGDFFSPNISGAQRLPNGNTLICEGARGRFFEVTQEGETVWEYLSPMTGSGPLNQGEQPTQGGTNGNMVFRAERYGADFPGLKGRDLTPGGYLEGT